MIASGRTTCQPGDAITGFIVHQLNERLAAHVQPGVKPGDRLEIFADQPNTGHLRIKCNGSDRFWFNTAGFNTLPHGPGRRCVEILIFLLHHTRPWVK